MFLFFLKTLKVKINNNLNFDATNNVFGDQNEKSHCRSSQTQCWEKITSSVGI